MPSLFRSQHACYDSGDSLLMVVNSDDPTPFVSILETRSGKWRRRIAFPHALGLGECAYRRADRSFYLAVRGLPGDQTGAIESIAVDQIWNSKASPSIFPTPACPPSAFEMDGAEARALVSCGPLDARAPYELRSPHGVALQSKIFDFKAKHFVSAIGQVGNGEDIGLDKRRARWYVAAPAMTDTGFPDGTATPVVGVIDARTGRWLESLPSGNSAHSVAVDDRTGRVFVPIRQVADSDGGVLVLTPKN
jgi:hypothetical protein